MTPKKLTQSALIERGWTKTMIQKLLPEPTLARNPYSRQSNIKMWDIADVEAAEQTEDYAREVEKAARRRASAAKAIATKTAALEKSLSAVLASVRIPILDDAELRRRAFEHYEQRRTMRHNYFDEYADPPEWADELTKQRWIVNYIRHALVEYDSTLLDNKGRTGMASQYYDFKDAILAKIAEAYPKYAEECRRQSFTMPKY